MGAFFWKRNRKAAAGAFALAAGILANALMTDYPLGVFRLYSFKAHGALTTAWPLQAARCPRFSASRTLPSGATVVVSARRSQLLDEVANECDSLGGRGIAIPADVSFKDEVKHLAESAASAIGRIDVWVNNAGAGAVGSFEEVPLEEHIQVIETDLLGTLYGSYFAMREFRKQGSGTLINVSSMIGKVPAPYFASYAAAKHGVIGLSAAMRLELKENNIDTIHVSTILPTSMDTPFFEHAANYMQRKTIPIPPIEEAQKVVDAILKVARDPEDEITVGTTAPLMTFAHRMAPELTEAMMARQVQKAQVEKAPPAENTPGAVQQPMAKGKSVSGGWKK